MNQFVKIHEKTFSHERVNIKIYLAIYALVATLFSAYNLFLVYKSAAEFPVDINITGSVGELFQVKTFISSLASM